MGAAPVRPLLYISLAATSWGSAGAAAALLYRTSGLSPIAVSCWRFAMGAVLLLAGRAFIARAVGKGRTRPIALVATGVLMAVFQTGYLAAVAFAGLSVGTAAWGTASSASRWNVYTHVAHDTQREAISHMDPFAEDEPCAQSGEDRPGAQRACSSADCRAPPETRLPHTLPSKRPAP
ncbi:hypothetical protein PV417_08230 [Streptomyces sp. ME19-03-3]|nr:hypothetical protein [Streptomyces sp. ME19-03-3]